MKLGKLINSGISILCSVLLGLIVLLSFLQIVLRDFFSYSIPWTDELSQFSMTWLALFGSIWLIQNNQHLSSGIRIHQKLKERQIHLIDGIVALVIAVTTAVIAYRSAIFSLSEMSVTALSVEGIKMGYVFIVLPLSMLCICCYYFKSFLKNLVLVFKKIG
jgi:C4-dicarboxylate transporter DctQ subunit